MPAKPDRRLRGVAGLSLGVGIAAAGEVAATVISNATGHPVGPRWSGLYNPIDGLHWFASVNQYCTIAPHIAGWKAALHHQPVAPSACRINPVTVTTMNVRSGVALALSAIPLLGLRLKEWYAHSAPAGRVLPRAPRGPGHVVVEIGRSTGQLAARGLTDAGLRAGQKVIIADTDLCLNVMIMGEIGAGKTFAGIVPILHAALAQDCGAVIGSGKGNIHRIVLALGEQTGREIRMIGFGPDSEHIDLCSQMTAETAKGYLSSLLRAQDKGKDSDSWINAATNMSRGVLGLLKMHEDAYPNDKSHFSYPGMFRYLYGRGGLRQQIDDKLTLKITEWVNQYNSLGEGEERDAVERKLRDVESYQEELVAYTQTTDGIRSSVDHALRQVLSQLATPAMEDAFFNKKPSQFSAFSFADTYEEGAVFVIHAPEAEIGADTSAIIISLVKAIFFSSMARRLVDDVNQERLVGLFIDECQDVASGSASGQDSDHTAIAKLRETRAFCVWATQSMNALEVKLGAPMTKALLANFVHKLVFRIKDVTTQQDAVKLLGDVEVDKETTSINRQSKGGTSRSTSKSKQLQAVAKAELFLNLKNNQALFISTLHHESAVDVITCTPEFVT